MTPIEKREDILRLAIDIVCADRNNQYGEPEDNFSIIGELWGAYLTARCASTGVTVKIGAQEAADMLILFKVARSATATTPKLDTYVDIAGYAACAGAIIDKAVPSKPPLNIENEPIRTDLFCQECQWSINHKCGHIETCDSRCQMYNEQVGKCKCLTLKPGDTCPYFEKWDDEEADCKKHTLTIEEKSNAIREWCRERDNVCKGCPLVNRKICYTYTHAKGYEKIVAENYDMIFGEKK